MQLNKKDLNFIKNTILEYIKTKNKFPTFKDLLEYYNSTQIEILLKTLETNNEFVNKKYNELLLEILEDLILKKSNNKIKKIIRDIYLKNKELFIEFFKLNLDKNNINSKEFNDNGFIIQNLISKGLDELTGNIKKQSFNDLFFLKQDSYLKYIKIFFPYYNYIGVKINNTNK